ncbi:hypothetical protein FB45DRAFT_940612 [Roridomyces roridus]|uniref:Uncharacterized protein n=1 Tax=Roridomyces roridus TaxID=1738132 RepID=A0AAD7B5V5_9AGAR|nr:hypothetical protein FB45DRAFT_940612 [Roridomyces roridus]
MQLESYYNGLTFYLADKNGTQVNPVAPGVPHMNLESDEPDVVHIIADIEIQDLDGSGRKPLYIAHWRVGEPKNLRCQLHAQHPDTGEMTLAVLLHMEADKPRQRYTSSRNKLVPPFNKYAMLQAREGGSVTLRIRRFKEEEKMHKSKIADAADGEIPSSTEQDIIFQYRFKHTNHVESSAVGRKRAKRTRESQESSGLSNPPSKPPFRKRAKKVKKVVSPSAHNLAPPPAGNTNVNVDELLHQLKEADKKKKEVVKQARATLEQTHKDTAVLQEYLDQGQ